MRKAETEFPVEPDGRHYLFDAGAAIADAVNRQRFAERGVDGLARMQRAVGVLEHHLTLTGEGTVDAMAARLAENVDLTGPLRRQACDRLQHGRLAGATFTNEGEAFAIGNLEVDVVRDMRFAVEDIEVLEGKRRHFLAHALRSSTGSSVRVSSRRGMEAMRPRV
ncbi:hypothetical protein D9M72_575930 [compost metagenome]